MITAPNTQGNIHSLMDMNEQATVFRITKNPDIRQYEIVNVVAMMISHTASLQNVDILFYYNETGFLTVKIDNETINISGYDLTKQLCLIIDSMKNQNLIIL